jgi:ribosomal protein S18 acetylase RimI-like enzyme
MQTQLYFLRSSEAHVITKILPYAYRLDTLKKSLSDVSALNIYKDFYGYTNKDLGLYALYNNEIAGAIWSRKMIQDHNCQAFIDEKTPVISMAVLPKFQKMGIGSMMMEQFLQEAATLYEALCVSVLEDSHAMKFYEKFGFETLRRGDTSVIDGSSCVTMVKKLEKKELTRPSDGYDPRRWMD